MKNCLIYQPLGLGDIFWVQPIVNKYIADGYNVHYPVGDIYYDMICKYIFKKGLTWYKESENFPLKEFYGRPDKIENENNIYLPLRCADQYVPSPLLLSKYYWTGVPISDWRKSFVISRNYEREEKLCEIYNLHGDYVLKNMRYGTYPNTLTRNIDIDTNLPIHVMSIEQDMENGFHLFDWIKALQNAKKVYTVDTSICMLMDIFCTDNEIHMYPRADNEYYCLQTLLWRNGNWIFEL